MSYEQYHIECTASEGEYLKLSTYRIIKCFGLEGTFRGHLAQPSLQ